MKITINYESSWRNSFLEGDNNKLLPGQGRKFIGSMTSLRNADNYIEREITIDTVMGVLNRLIGDQRKLYQARVDSQYFFREIEPKVNFCDKPQYINSEVAYIRNIMGSTDQNSYTGMVKVNDPIFTSDYSSDFWSILALEPQELCEFIINDEKFQKSIDNNPLTIISRLEELNKLRPEAKAGKFLEAYEFLSKRFEKFKGTNKNEEILPIRLYCSALYLQLERLSSLYDMSSAVTKAGRLSGISNNGFTKKDFMNHYTTGDKKKIWGNPFVREEYIAGEGKIKRLLKKVSGQLEISIAIGGDQAKRLEQLIDYASVSSFYLGKKGLAYVSDIRI